MRNRQYQQCDRSTTVQACVQAALRLAAALPLAAFLLAAFLLASPSLAWAGKGGPAVLKTWVCYYGPGQDKSLSRFDLAVLESSHHPAPAKSRGKPVCLGYASLGEVDEDGRYKDVVADKPFVLEKNPNWNSRFVDVRDPAWRAVVLERIIPDILSKGYDGLFLDTLDSSIHLEQTDPGRYSGMTRAAVELVREIRTRFPKARICLNRAAPILEELAPVLDYALLECLYSDYDFEAKAYRKVPPADREELLTAAAKARKANPALTVLSLDYADPADAATIREAIAFSRKHKLVPYVSTPELDSVHTFTLGR